MKKTNKWSKGIIAYFLAATVFLCNLEVSFAQEESAANADCVLLEEVTAQDEIVLPSDNVEISEDEENFEGDEIHVDDENPSDSRIPTDDDILFDYEIPATDKSLEDDNFHADNDISVTDEILTEGETSATDERSLDFEILADEETGGFRMVPGENDIERTYTSFTDGTESFYATGMPERYITQKLPDLRNQFYSTCWAHATMALAEINLMKKGIENGQDLSELHTVWFSYNSVTDPLGGTLGDSNKVPAGTNILGVGGNPVFSQNVLATWCGAADEELLKSSDAASVRNKSLVPSDELAYMDTAHLTNIYEVNLKENRDGAKYLIKEKGAIAISYYSASGNSPDTAYDTYNSATGAYYDKSTHGGKQNHAVVVVGWDDNFSKDNFLVKPSLDGAWLVRNSWTTGSLEEGIENPSYSGYFWMSYENASTASGARAFEMDVSDNFAHNYQYDGAMYRTGWTPDSYTKNELRIANIFTTKACENGEVIRAAAFQTSSSDLEYMIELYTDLSDTENPESGRKITEATTVGTTNFPGYYTVPLSMPVPVYHGHSFAVVVTLKKNGGIPAISREQSWSGWTTITADMKEGQSFFYDDGWKDLYSQRSLGGNLAIKAFTDDIPLDAVYIPKKLEFEGGLSRTGLTISPLEQKALRIYFTPFYVSDPTVTFHSSDPDIATVDSDGVLLGLSEGRATITATSNAAAAVSNSFVVTVRKKDKWLTDPVKEADAKTRAALAEDLSITGKAVDGTLTDDQVYEILSRVSSTDDFGNRVNTLWVGGIDGSEGAYVYTGEAIKPLVHVYDGIKLLKEKKDYTLSYSNNKNVGQAKVTVRFKGNYKESSKVINYTIAPARLGSDVTADEIVIRPKKNNGAQKPVPVLRNASTGAVMAFKASSFDITYSNEDEETILKAVTAPGRYTARVAAKTKKGQNYQGELLIPILVTTSITPLSQVSVNIEKKSYVYTGDKIVPKLIITDMARNDILREGVDYSLDIRNNINPGKATAIIKGSGIRYAGMRSVTFQIKSGKKADSDSINIEYEQTVPYLKSGAGPKVTVTDDGRMLTEGIDYTISLKNNKKITQKAVLSVKFKGYYTGTVTKYYSIERQKLDKLQCEKYALDVVLTDKADSYKKTAITLTDNDGKKLTTSDYRIVGFVNANDGSKVTLPKLGDSIIVTVAGSGGYEGEVSLAYTLISSSMKLSVAKQAKKVQSVRYTGEAAILPDDAFEGLLTTKAGEALVSGEDFEIISYSDNNGCGTGHVTLRGISKSDGKGFGGVRTFSFSIKPRQTDNFVVIWK